MSNIADDLGINEILAGKSILSRPADEFGNDPTLEAMWAAKAFEHAEIYFNILCSVDPTVLRLTPHDDKIYTTFRADFPDMDVKLIIEDEIKSIAGKMKWRDFCEKFKGVVEDYSYGTLVRGDVTDEYTEKNSILVTRIQFYAIEITRNREGLNNDIRNKFKPAKSEKNSGSNS